MQHDDYMDASSYLFGVLMGCDIHLYSETRKDGKWVADLAHTLTTPTQEELDNDEQPELERSYTNGRNYSLFGLLTNGEVRRDCSFGLPNHGPAENMSTEVAKEAERWEGDAHSHNHLTVKELKEKAMELLVIPDPEAREFLPMLTGLIQGLPASDNPDPQEQRIVFWFDN